MGSSSLRFLSLFLSLSLCVHVPRSPVGPSLFLHSGLPHRKTRKSPSTAPAASDHGHCRTANTSPLTTSCLNSKGCKLTIQRQLNARVSARASHCLSLFVLSIFGVDLIVLSF